MIVQVDLESGTRRSWVELEEKELIDLCGGETPGQISIFFYLLIPSIQIRGGSFSREVVSKPLYVLAIWEVERP